MLKKCVLTILKLNWNQRLGQRTKLNICNHMLTSSTQLQNRSFPVVERTRTSSKCQKVRNARAKRAKNTVFHCQMCKFMGFLLPSSSWLLKLPNICWRRLYENSHEYLSSRRLALHKSTSEVRANLFKLTTSPVLSSCSLIISEIFIIRN